MSERRGESRREQQGRPEQKGAAAKKTLREILQDPKRREGALVIFAKGEEPSVIPLEGPHRPKKNETRGKDEAADAVADMIAGLAENGDVSKDGETVFLYVKRVDGPTDEQAELDMEDPYVKELLTFLNEGAQDGGTADGGASDSSSGSDGGGGGGGE